MTGDPESIPIVEAGKNDKSKEVREIVNDSLEALRIRKQ